MSKFLAQKYTDLEAYTPGEQPKVGTYIKLNTNENPFPPAPGSQEAVSAKVETLNIYCDNTCQALTTTFANYHNIEEENVIFANGSDEILAFCFLAFCDEQIGAAFPEISYGFYKVFAKLFSIEPEKIPLAEDLSIKIQDYFGKNKTIVIANPNAPTGIALTPAQIEEILKANPENVVIIDEAYVDFGGESVIPLTKIYDNLIVSGTFSKSRNLAGARLGYAVASKDLIADLNKIKYSYNPYNVNALTQVLGKVSIEQDEYFKNCIAKVVAARDEFVKDIANLGFETLPSSANLIFTKHKTAQGSMLYNQLRKQNVLVRHFDDEKIKDYLRISIGTMEDMKKVAKILEEILAENQTENNTEVQNA